MFHPNSAQEVDDYLLYFGDCWLQRILLCPQQQAWATDDVAQIYDKCMADLEQHLHAIPPALALNPQTQALRSLLEAVALARNSRDGIAALGLLQKVRLTVVMSAMFLALCRLLLQGPQAQCIFVGGGS